MNTILRFGPMLIAALVWSLSAQAHDPSMHKQDGEQPDCAAMEQMKQGPDMQGKDAKQDPVMQAMLKQCADHHGDDADGDHHHDDHHADGHNDHMMGDHHDDAMHHE